MQCTWENASHKLMQRRMMSVVTVGEVTQGRVVVASPVCIRQLQYKHISLHPTLDCDAHLSCIAHLTNCLHPSHFISQLSAAAPPPLDSSPSSAGHMRTCTNIIFWWILARDPIINYSWCIIQSRGWGCVDARPLCLTKHRVLVYCWRTNSLEQSFSSPSRGELWLELFSRHSLILQFRLNTTKSLQIKYSLARSFWYCFCERPWNVKHFNI